MSALTQEIELVVRAGRFAEARRKLRELQPRRIPRPDALACANLARRVEMGSLSLKILNPIVRPEKRTGQPATVEERIEYAAALRSLGALPEAQEILLELDRRRYPAAGFQLALCHIAKWDYSPAIPILRECLQDQKELPYPLAITRINLVEALIHESLLPEAFALIRDLRMTVDISQFPLLHRKLFELQAEYEIATGNFRGSVKSLEAAEAAGSAGGARGQLFIRKWKSVSLAMEEQRVTPALREVREEARRLGHWETVRDCDFYIASIGGDTSALIRLYFGTPYAAYRRRISGCIDAQVSLPDHYTWRDGPKSGPPQIFDLALARSIHAFGTPFSLNPGQALHRLLILLCQDFHRPLRGLSIFSQLFPKEKFHPESSPNRVRQVLKRFRGWLAESKSGITLEENSGSYRLESTGVTAIRIPLVALPLEPRKLELIRLRREIASPEFTFQQAVQALGGSGSVAKLVLRRAIAEKTLDRFGATNQARYRWREGE